MDNEKNKKNIVDNSNDVISNENKENDENNELIDVSKDAEQFLDKEKNVELTVQKEKRMGLNNKGDNKRKYIFISLIITSIVILIFGIFACINKLNSNVYKNVYILGQNIGGYSVPEIREILDSKNNSSLYGKINVYQDTESIYTILESDIELKLDVESTLNNIMNFGRSGNIFKDNFNILIANFKKVYIEPTYLYNEEKLDEIIKNIDLSIKDRLIESKYSIDEANKKLVITIGKSGNGINFDTEKEKILNEIKKNYNSNSILEDKKIYLNIITKSNLDLDAEEIYSKVKREPQDAYIDKTTTPAKSVSEVAGLNINLDLLKEELSDSSNKVEGKIIEIPLEIIEPNIKLEDLDKELYKDKLAGYTTYFDASQYARSNNLKIALEYLNGKVVMPGEVFSYNDAIGDTTAAKGYMPAATFKGGTTVNEMGGGICQTTSTLYNVVLMANLEIVERHQHGLPVGYVQPSRDATVYSPYLDFKFKNTRSNPIKIVTSYSSSGNLNISLYGIKEQEEYEVELISQYLGTIPYTTRYIYDSSMNEGNQVVINRGVNGYTSQCFIQKKLNGVQVSYELLSKDTYNAQQQVIKVGTKKVNNNQGS